MSRFADQSDEVLKVIGRLAALAGASLLVIFILGIALRPLLPNGLPIGRDGRMIYLIMVSLSLAIGHLLAGIFLERGQWEPTGLGPGAWKPLALLTALALGAAAISAPAVVLLFTGHVDVVAEPGAHWSTFAADAILVVALLALVQELAFRGYAIGLIAERWGDVAALVVTSGVAGLIQLRASPLSIQSIVGVVALAACLGAIRLRTSSVAASWLAHVAFSWTQLAVLHSPLRAAELPTPPGYLLNAGGPAWLTGGTHGLAEGVAVAASLAVVTFLVFRPRPTNTRQARV